MKMIKKKKKKWTRLRVPAGIVGRVFGADPSIYFVPFHVEKNHYRMWNSKLLILLVYYPSRRIDEYKYMYLLYICCQFRGEGKCLHATSEGTILRASKELYSSC